MALNLWEIHFSRDLRTCSSTLFLHPSSSPPWGPAHNLQRSRPGLSSLPPPPLLSPSLSKNPLLLYSFLSRTLMNFRDKHTNLLYKNMAAVHVTLRTKHSLRSSSLVSLRHDPPCDVHFLSFFSFSSFFFFFFFFFPAPNFPIFYADDFPRLIKLEERFLTFLHRDKRTCNFHNL